MQTRFAFEYNTAARRCSPPCCGGGTLHLLHKGQARSVSAFMLRATRSYISILNTTRQRSRDVMHNTLRKFPQLTDKSYLGH